MKMNRTVLYTLMSSYIASSCLAMESSFVPLSEDEYVNATLALKAPGKQVIEAKLIQGVPKNIVQCPLVALMTDIVEVTQKNHELEIVFQPYGLIPGVIVPSEFPLDANELIATFLSRQKWVQKEGVPFGKTEGKIQTGPQMEYTIGYWEFTLANKPQDIIRRLLGTLMIIQQENLKITCQKNPFLMTCADEFLNGNSTASENITLENLTNLCELLAYNLGGKVTKNPQEGIAVNVSFATRSPQVDLNLPFEKKGRKEQYKTLLRDCFRYFLGKLEVTFDKDNKTFVTKFAFNK